jgi:cytochrome c5
MATPTDPQHKALRSIHFALWALGFVLIVGTLLTTAAWQGKLSDVPNQDSTAAAAAASVPVDAIVDGKDVETGLIAADGYLTVKQNCTSCHSAKLITQNHLSRDRWENTIRWMQKNQNLGDLGASEPIILDYLATNYGPQNTGRRKPLDQPQWYPLK